jgi:hypothetical protein
LTNIQILTRKESWKQFQEIYANVPRYSKIIEVLEQAAKSNTELPQHT